MKILCLKSAILFILIGCSAKEDMEIIINKNFYEIESFPENSELKFTKLIDYNVGMPYKLYEVDSGLFIFDIDARDDRVFHFYSFPLDSFTASYIGKGSGPYETFSPKSSGIVDKTLWVQDFTMHKVIENDLTNLDAKESQKETKLVDYFSVLEIFNENEIFANGLMGSQKKFQKLNRHTGEILGEFGDFEKVPEIIKGDVFKYFFQAFFALKPDRKQLVSAYRWNEAIEIFNLETSESFLIRGPGNINNEFALKKDEFGVMKFGRGGEIQHCNVDVAATDQYIFVLFSGNYDNVIDPFLSDIIHVYSWDGSPIAKLELDRKVMSFSISPDSKTLYSFDMDAGEIIYITLDLPE